jgi:hypothetical protein
VKTDESNVASEPLVMSFNTYSKLGHPVVGVKENLLEIYNTLAIPD